MKLPAVQSRFVPITVQTDAGAIGDRVEDHEQRDIGNQDESGDTQQCGWKVEEIAERTSCREHEHSGGTADRGVEQERRAESEVVQRAWHARSPSSRRT